MVTIARQGQRRAFLSFVRRVRRGRSAGYWAFARYNWHAEADADNKHLWLSSNSLNRYYKIDLDTRKEVQSWGLSANGSTAMGVVRDGNRAWIGHEENSLTVSLVSELNTDTGVVTDRTATTKQRARGVAQDASYVYVGLASVSTENCRLMRIAKSDGAVTTLDLGVSADIWFTLAVVGTSLYVGLSTGQVVKVNLSTWAVAATIAANVSNDLRGVVKHPTTNKLYFSAYGADKVRGLNTSTDAWAENWATGSWPMGLALTPSGDHLYTHETYANQWRSIRVSDGVVIDSAKPLHPTTLQSGFGVPAMQPDGKFAYFHSLADGDKFTGTGYLNTVAVTLS